MKIESVKINWIIDEYPDLSWLESSITDGVIDSCRYSQKDYEENPELWKGYRFENHKARDKTVKCCKSNITNSLCQIDTKHQP